LPTSRQLLPPQRILDNANMASLPEAAQALHTAVRNADIVKVGEILASHAIKSLDQPLLNVGTPLHSAIELGHIAIVDALLAAGADIEVLALDSTGEPLDTALSLAIRLKQRGIAKRLWEAGATRWFESIGRGITALELAASCGPAEMVGDLLSWSGGWDRPALVSALWHAAVRWDADAIQVLLENENYAQADLENALVAGARPKPFDPSSLEWDGK